MHESGDSVQVQPAPVMAVAVRSTGSASLSVTVPTVGPVPLLVTVSEYVAPIWPGLKGLACVFAIVRSGTSGGGVVGIAVFMSTWICADDNAVL